MTDRTTRAKRALEQSEEMLGEVSVLTGRTVPERLAALVTELARDVIELEAECEVLRQQRDYDYREALDGFAGLHEDIDWLESVLTAGREMYERACAERDAEREACERWVQRAANRGRLLERLELRLRDIEDRTGKVK